MPSKKEPVKLRGKSTAPPVERLRRSDSELVEAYVRGEERAFDELVNRYQAKLISFIRSIVRDRERAEDLTQETFYRIFKHIRNYDFTKKFSTWVYTIASNQAKNELRNNKRNRIFFINAFGLDWLRDNSLIIEFEDPRAATDKHLEQIILLETIESTLRQLTHEHRTLLVLVDMEGRSYAEAGKIVGCRIGTVKSRLSRARGEFRKVVSKRLQ